MSLPSRRLLLACLAAAFFILGAGAVLYAQGYRLDTETLHLTKVGGMFIRSFPKDAAIQVDGEPFENQSGLFGSGTLIGGLFPRTYDVALLRAGYLPWRRSVQVFPSLVSDVKFAVLVPATSTTVATSSASAFWALNGGVLLQTPAGTLFWNQDMIPGNVVLGATDDGTRLLTQTTSPRAYFWIDLETGNAVNVASLAPIGAATPALDPANSSKLLLLTSSSLSVADLQRNTVTPVTRNVTGRLRSPTAGDTYIAWGVYHPVAHATEIFIYHKNSGVVTPLGESFGGELRELRFQKDVLGVLMANGDFFVARLPGLGAHLKGTGVTVFSFDEEGARAAIVEPRGLAVFSLKETMYTRFNLGDAQNIAKLTWYRDGQHLFLHYPEPPPVPRSTPRTISATMTGM